MRAAREVAAGVDADHMTDRRLQPNRIAGLVLNASHGQYSAAQSVLSTFWVMRSRQRSAFAGVRPGGGASTRKTRHLTRPQRSIR